MRLVFSYLTTPGKNFIYQHVDKMDISENWQFFKCWKTGILTEFLCNCVSTFFDHLCRYVLQYFLMEYKEQYCTMFVLKKLSAKYSKFHIQLKAL